jgi:hypothetical protein
MHRTKDQRQRDFSQCCRETPLCIEKGKIGQSSTHCLPLHSSFPQYGTRLVPKLKRVLEYLHGTLDEFLTLGADDITMMRTWVDASYAIHKDMKSHTGGVVSFGRGAIMSKSSKQKLNTKSSTEAELVEASDYLPYPIWGKKFLEAQGYTLKENIFYQDNQSTIRFAKNGRKSCGPNSRHIDIRYFFIKDRLGLEDTDVQYCPTEQMLADFYTKPLQGNLFRKFRAVIMGHVQQSKLPYGLMITLV